MSSEKPQTDWDAIARYLAGESPAAERDAVQQWLSSRPADSATIAALDDALDGLTLGTTATSGIDVEAALARVNARRAEASNRGGPAVGLSFIRPAKVGWIGWAAAAAIIIGVTVVAERSRPASDAPTTIAARELTTPVGGRDSLVLPDGSQVILGPGSHLTIAAGYGQASREVALRGEAYFEVTHDAARPFVVDANGSTVRDIGTAFAVHADSTGGVRVAVKSGIVELSHAASATPRTVLNAGDVGTVSAGGDLVAERGAVSADDLAWTQGTLVFRDATIGEVRDDLRRWYGIELVVRDSSVLRRHMTATFTQHDSAASVLKTIGLLLPATIERRGDTAVVWITPEPARRK